MSKNFELLTQLGEKYAPLRASSAVLPATEQSAEADAPPCATMPSGQCDDASFEEIRLAQRLFLSPGHAAPKAVVFCGVVPDDDPGLLCARVAEIASACSGGRVCLIDAQPCSPALSRRYALETGLIPADKSLPCGTRETLRQVPGRSLWILTPGLAKGANGNLLPADYFRALLPSLEQQFRTVLIIARPANLCPDAITLGQLVDGVVLVMKANSTRRAAARRAKEVLESSQVRVIGAVLTERTYPIPEGLYRRM